eukprot:2821350-Amphidinium_carterae.1
MQNHHPTCPSICMEYIPALQISTHANHPSLQYKPSNVFPASSGEAGKVSNSELAMSGMSKQELLTASAP